MSVGSELQAALYLALNTALTGIAGVYDEVPQLPVGMPDTSFPYVEIGDVGVVPFDTDDNTGYEAYVLLHVWSRYRGKKEAHDIFEVCRNTLHRQTLTLTNWSVFDILQTGEFVVKRESDNTTIHGFGRFVFKLTAG